MTCRLNGPIIAIAFTAAVTSNAAFAGGNTSQSQKGALPGVTSDYRIAQPAPQPEPDDAPPASGNGTFKVGDTDVRISGTITIDVGTHRFKPSNR